MHRPGYVQGGQEANRGYLLLGVYHRRIPGDTVGDGMFIVYMDKDVYCTEYLCLPAITEQILCHPKHLPRPSYFRQQCSSNNFDQRHILRGRCPSTDACTACWAMGTKEFKLCTVGKK